MSQIFSKAFRVLVYLGEANKSITTLFQLFTEVIPYGQGLLRVKIANPGRYTYPRHGAKMFWDTMWTYARFEIHGSLQDLFSRLWFFRVWVLQEVALAQQAVCLCGSQVLPWDHLLMLNLNMLNSSFMLRHRDPQNRPGDMLDLATSVPPAILLQLEHEQESRRTSSLLGDFRVCNASDPRDKVFEILGLANDQREASFRPDYSKSTAQTFIDFAVYTIIKRKMPISDLLS